MTDDDIIRWAKEAATDELPVAVFTVNELKRFAALVAAAEREQILTLTDSLGWVDSAAIRARGTA